MSLPFFFSKPSLIHNTLRLCGVAVLGVTLSACSVPGVPKVKVGREWFWERFARADDGVLESDKLALSLAKVEEQRDAYPTELTEKFILALQAEVHLHDWRKPMRIQGKAGSWEVSFHDPAVAGASTLEWEPALFDRLIPASAFKLQGYEQIIQGSGAGVPVVLAFEDVERLREARAFRPSNGLYVAGTVVLEFGKPKAAGEPTPVKCRIINTFTERKMKLADRQVRLAYNVTAAVQVNLDNPYIRKNGLAGLLRPGERTEKDTGLFGITSFDPSKIPVVFIHGLDSAPHIWTNAVNEIYRDPALRARYVPLLFMYPSGLPVPAAAAKLRKSIQQYRDQWDPKHEAKGFDNMVLVGHSMGGLLTRLQVINSGDEMWKAFFVRPVAEIPWLGKNDRRSLESSLNFQHQAHVKRVVFVAVPHKGSEIADVGIVKLVVRLIKLPVSTAGFVARALTDDVSVLNPALLKYHSLGMKSVDMLSPGHPYFEAIDKCSICTPYHSIIGDRGKAKLEKSSDGVVPYWSSHVPGAVSEEIVPFGHSCTLKSETVREIMRILRLHAGTR